MSQKDILLTGFNRFELPQIEELIRKHKLQNIYAEIPADGIDENTLKMVIRHGLNLIVPVDCVEQGHNSIASILLRNPKFEELIAEIPRGKVSFLRRCKREMKEEDIGNSIIALGRSYEHRIFNMRGSEEFCSYHTEMEVLRLYQEQYTDPEYDVSNVEFIPSYESRFDIINYGLLRSMGIIGVKECLVLTK
tara:strand:- start:9983 stop:10558 length:576 start_codon:yes stop_codon:yes gene_type:complete